MGQSQCGKTSIAKALAQTSESVETDMPVHQFRYGDAMITMFDTLGDPIDVKTSIQGSFSADGIMLVIPADVGPNLQTGEKIIIANLLGLDRGVIILNKLDLSNPDDIESIKNKIKAFVKGTTLENLQIIETSASTNTGIPELREALSNIKEPERKVNDPFRIDLDGSYEKSGRGIGTGVIQSGKINSHGKVQLMPWGKVFPIDHILLGNKEENDVQAGQRVGIAIKGVFPWDLPRGTIFCDEGTVSSSKEIDCELDIHPFYKEPITVSQQLHGSIGLQWFPIEVKSMDGEFSPGKKVKLKIEAQEVKYPIVFAKNEEFLICRPDLSHTQLRVCGKAKII